jgi:hypothetical protein
MSGNGWLCATCLRAGTPVPAVTFVDGTAVCADHLPGTPDDGGSGVAGSLAVDLGDLDEGIQHHMK